MFRLLPLDLHPDLPHRLHLPDGHPGRVEVHSHSSSSDQQEVVQHACDRSDDNRCIRDMPSDMCADPHDHGHRSEGGADNGRRSVGEKFGERFDAGAAAAKRDRLLHRLHRLEHHDDGHLLDLQRRHQADSVYPFDRAELAADLGARGDEEETTAADGAE